MKIVERVSSSCRGETSGVSVGRPRTPPSAQVVPSALACGPLAAVAPQRSWISEIHNVISPPSQSLIWRIAAFSNVSAGRTSDRLHVRWPHGLQMKFDVYERVRDPLHGRQKVGGVREGFAQVLDRCFSLRVHVLSSVALLGSMSSSSGVSKSSSRDTGSRITERPAADLRYVEQGERDEQRGPLSESHHRDGPRPLASRRLDSRHNDRLRPLQQLIPEAAPDKIDLELRRRARHIEVQRTCPYSQGAPCFNP